MGDLFSKDWVGSKTTNLHFNLPTRKLIIIALLKEELIFESTLQCPHPCSRWLSSVDMSDLIFFYLIITKCCGKVSKTEPHILTKLLILLFVPHWSKRVVCPITLMDSRQGRQRLTKPFLAPTFRTWLTFQCNSEINFV